MDRDRPGRGRIRFSILLFTAASVVASISAPVGATVDKKPKKPKLNSMLLSVTQLPTGWATTSKQGSGVGCLSHVLEPARIRETHHAQAGFAANTGLLSEKLTTYAVPAKRVFRRIIRDLQRCKHVSGTVKGNTVKITVNEMSFPHFGQQSAAFEETYQSGSTTLRGYSVVVRSGSIILGLNAAGLSLSQVEGILTTALNNLAKRHKSVHPTSPTTTGPSGPSTTGAAYPTRVSIPKTFFGNVSPSLKPGKPGALDVIYIGPPKSNSGTTVPVVVWNGTSSVYNHLDISGSATVGGSVVGSGDSQEVQPSNLAPGAAAFGMVYFSNTIPAGATFNFTATGNSGTTPGAPNLKVTQANYQPSSTTSGAETIVGAVVNTGSATVTGPMEVDVYCFTGNTLTALMSGFVSGTISLPSGGTGSYSVTGFTPCPSHLVGASGFSNG